MKSVVIRSYAGKGSPVATEEANNQRDLRENLGMIGQNYPKIKLTKFELLENGVSLGETAILTEALQFLPN